MITKSLNHIFLFLGLILLTTVLNAQSVVDVNGLLKVEGSKIVNKNNEAVSFAGNSFFWTNNDWGGLKFYTPGAVSWLKKDWETTMIRAACGVEDWGGYLDAKEDNVQRVKTLVNAAIDKGLYVVIDWHSHHAEDHRPEAIEFFNEMSTLYGDYDNVIYEIYNEPLDVSWSSVLKPYALAVVETIRKNDPDNLILMGSPEWSQRVDLVANDPITGFENIAYTLHFYTVHHQKWLRDRADAAMAKGIAIVITEWGSIGYTENDPETDAWMAWCLANDVTHLNWAVNDKLEEWSILTPGSSPNGNWNETNLTKAGKLAKDIIKNWPKNFPSAIGEAKEKGSLSIYPNPASNQIYITDLKFENEKPTYTIFDISGRIADKGSVDPAVESFSINIVNFPSGSYQLVIETEKKLLNSQFIKN